MAIGKKTNKTSKTAHVLNLITSEVDLPSNEHKSEVAPPVSDFSQPPAPRQLSAESEEFSGETLSLDSPPMQPQQAQQPQYQPQQPQFQPQQAQQPQIQPLQAPSQTQEPQFQPLQAPPPPLQPQSQQPPQLIPEAQLSDQIQGALSHQAGEPQDDLTLEPILPSADPSHTPNIISVNENDTALSLQIQDALSLDLFEQLEKDALFAPTIPLEHLPQKPLDPQTEELSLEDIPPTLSQPQAHLEPQLPPVLEVQPDPLPLEPITPSTPQAPHLEPLAVQPEPTLAPPPPVIEENSSPPLELESTTVEETISLPPIEPIRQESPPPPPQPSQPEPPASQTPYQPPVLENPEPQQPEPMTRETPFTPPVYEAPPQQPTPQVTGETPFVPPNFEDLPPLPNESTPPPPLPPTPARAPMEQFAPPAPPSPTVATDDKFQLAPIAPDPPVLASELPTEELDPNAFEEVNPFLVERNPMRDRAPNEPITYYNLTETIVRDLTPQTMKQYSQCTCEQCLLDVLALTLTKLPPRYVVRHERALPSAQELYASDHRDDILAEIVRSCTYVNEHPRHPDS